MKTLLRCLFRAEATDQEEQLLYNYRNFLDAGLGFDVPEYNHIWEYIQRFVQQHNHIPQVDTLRTHFKHVGDESTANVLETLVGLKLRDRGDFDAYLEVKVEQHRMRLWTEILKETGTITTTGLEFKQPKGAPSRILKGPVDAVRYMLERSPEIVAPSLSTRLSGEVRSDAQDFIREYNRIKADPLAGIGQFCYIKQIDDAMAGAKRHELWLHAAFTGGLKSTFALNWAYSQAVYFGHGSMFFSLEMPYSQCRRILYSMHSGHPKFRAIRHQLGLQSTLSEDIGIPYQEIRDGSLMAYHPNAEHFMLDYVVPDFHDPANSPIPNPDPNGYEWPRQYGNIHIEVADPNKDDFTVADIRNTAEVRHSDQPFGMIFVDHAGLVAPRKKYSSTTESLNEVLRDLKKLAMSFKRGKGIAVVGLFQISREGYKSALKTQEKTGKPGYNLTHLSYANEAERCVAISSTYVRTPAGFQPIMEASQQAQTVLSASGWAQVKRVFDNGTRRIWEVVTDRGSKLDCTAPHRVRVVQDGQLGWKAVSELLPGQDYLVSTFGGKDVWPSTSPILPELSVAKHETGKGRKGEGSLKSPHKVTQDLAYLLGAWDGDGKIHPKGVSWTGNRKETVVRDRIRTCFEQTFGHALPLQESPSRPGSFDLVKWSQPLKRWFETVAGKRAGEVPVCILQSPREIVCAYLQGLFDADGWVNNQGVVGINMKGACEGFLRQVQMLLTALGIDSDLSRTNPLSSQTGKTYPKVLLRVRTRESTLRFHRDIGFSQEGKQVLQVSERASCKQMYPVPWTFLSAYGKVHPEGSAQTAFPRSFYNLPAKVRKTGLVPRGAVELLTQHASAKGIEGGDIQFLQHLLRLHVMRVASVEDTGRDEPVMDLEVSGDHEYQTGPILSHNSSDIVTASWVDDDLRDNNRVLFQCLKSRDQKPFESFQSRVEFSYRRILTCFDVPRSAADMAQKGAEMDKALKDLDG
jgi:hypothetical protein